MGFIKAARCINPLFKLDHMPRFHPPVKSCADGAGRGARFFSKLPDSFNGEIGQVFKNRKIVGFHIG